MMKRNDILPGFVLVNECGTVYLAVDYREKLYLMSDTYFVSNAPIMQMMDEDLNPINGYCAIVEIKDRNDISIWKKSVELTMQEIADKFGIPVEQLKIKK